MRIILQILLFITFLGLFAFLVWSVPSRHKKPKLGTVLSSDYAIPLAVPSTIYVWTYWQGKDSPLEKICNKQIDQACLQSSDSDTQYKHIRLTPDTVSEYLSDEELQHPCVDNNNVALRSDVIRLFLLKKYGGIWLDATIILFKPLKYLFQYGSNQDFRAFYNPKNITMGAEYPVIEVWLMASPPNHPLVVEWLEGYSSINDCSSDKDKLEYVKSTNIAEYGDYLSHTYHVTYFVLLNLLRKKGGLSNIPNIKLFDCEYMKCIVFPNYKFTDFTQLTASEFDKKYDIIQHPLIKFSKFGRNVVDQLLRIGYYSDDCILHNLPMIEMTNNTQKFDTNIDIYTPDKYTDKYIENKHISSAKLASKSSMSNLLQSENLVILNRIFNMYNIEYYIDCDPTIEYCDSKTHIDIMILSDDIQTIRSHLSNLEMEGFISYRNSEDSELIMTLIRNGEYINLYILK